MFKNQTLLAQSLTLIGIFCVATPSVADTTAPGDSTQHHCDTRFEPATPSYDFHSAQLADLEDRQIRNVHITRLPIFDESNEDENNWCIAGQIVSTC